jgi:DNA-binding CsgD family transcriptional regulator
MAGVRIDAGFVCRGDVPLVRFHTGGAPGAKSAPWTCALKGNPMHEHCVSNHKARVVRLSDVAPEPRDLLHSEFGQVCVKENGWHHAATLCFRHEEMIEAEVVLHRNERDGDFTDGEMSRLRQLHREIATALQHLRALHEEIAVRETLETLLRNSPTSLLLLNKRLRTVMCNRTAKQQCATWNLGKAARTINSPEAYRVPSLIRRQAEVLREQWQNGHSNGGTLHDRVVHPDHPGLEASLEVIESRGSCLGSPLIRVQFHQSELNGGTRKGNGAPDLSKLTAQELEVIRLVARGMSNLEIAAELSKSVFTVKTQVHTAFRKLGIRRRAKVMLLFR